MNAKFVEIRENNKELNQAAQAAKDVLFDDYNIAINYGEAIPTIAYAFIKEAAVFLSSNKVDGEDTRLELFDLLTLGINFTDTENDEKLNNFEPTVIPGPEMKRIVEDEPKNNDDDEE